MRLFITLALLFTLSACSTMGLGGDVAGCVNISLDGPTTDSSADGRVVLLPGDKVAELSTQDLVTLIQTCNTAVP